MLPDFIGRAAGSAFLAFAMLCGALVALPVQGRDAPRVQTHGHTGGARKAPGAARDKQGHIARSPHAKHEFEKKHPCPSTGKHSGACPGYVIDHVKPLKRGGKDTPGNMQWQTTEAAKIKNRSE